MSLLDRIRSLIGGDEPRPDESSTSRDVDRGAGVDRVGVDPTDSRKTGGHGSHWDAVTPESPAISDAIQAAIDDGERVEGRPVGGGTVLGHVHPAGDPVRTCAVSVDGLLTTAYPVADGVTHRVTVEEVTEWANDVEAQVTLGMGDASLGAFDATYFARPDLEAGDTCEVELAAFAYDLGRADEETVVTDEESLSTRGATAAVPFEGGDLDEYVVRSRPGTVEELDSPVGQGSIYRLRLPLFETDSGDEVAVDAYAADHVLEGMVPHEGEDLEGVFWMQARMA